MLTGTCCNKTPLAAETGHTACHPRQYTTPMCKSEETKQTRDVVTIIIYYERLPIHPPKHGPPDNYATDSWPWLSRVSVLGAPVRCLLLALVWVKHAACSMVSRHHNQNVRSYDVSFLQKINVIRPGIFFSTNMNIKRLLYIGQSDACTTKLANGTRTAL